ncbi:hypothetical protein [Noviherbaspirillum sp.]|uniref:hypothetical protein n=1 Tax=Noviherbaspirillum sp. TaxID=1926288 RepID=UPI002B47A046|nr:hypothetical protein [Noviherbaspirillum sp.]
MFFMFLVDRILQHSSSEGWAAKPNMSKDQLQHAGDDKQADDENDGNNPQQYFQDFSPLLVT